ncbi:MAG: CpcT/CpeT family chromophore lyase, partial [Kangiellaceae bacterium]|nr:CpcT/CpeT family chromophore lyase [Kangiellaceae bacterium]
TVYLAWREENKSYSGSTDTNKCMSKLRGATYATSEVIVNHKGIVSWDRGFDSKDKQVWGAVKAGYIFLKQ